MLICGARQLDVDLELLRGGAEVARAVLREAEQLSNTR